MSSAGGSRLGKLFAGDDVVGVGVKLLEEVAESQQRIRHPLQQFWIAECRHLQGQCAFKSSFSICSPQRHLMHTLF